jgi:hypothetical protein
MLYEYSLFLVFLDRSRDLQHAGTDQGSKMPCEGAEVNLEFFRVLITVALRAIYYKPAAQR